MTKPVSGTNGHPVFAETHGVKTIDSGAILVERAGAIDAAVASKIQEGLGKLTMFAMVKNVSKVEQLNALLTNIVMILSHKETVLKFQPSGIKLLLTVAKLSEADKAKYEKLWSGQPVYTPDAKEEGKKTEVQPDTSFKIEETEKEFYSRWCGFEKLPDEQV